MKHRARPVFITRGVRSSSQGRLMGFLAIVTAIVGVLGLFARDQIFGGDNEEPPGKLTLEDAVVRNGPFASSSAGLNGEQTKGSSPTIDITLFNAGGQPAI